MQYFCFIKDYCVDLLKLKMTILIHVIRFNFQIGIHF